MFTGIVQAVGRITRIEARGGDLRLFVDASALDAELAPGDSLCVSGVCLTVAAREAGSIAFDVSSETLALTTLGALREGDTVNLEPALRLSDRLGGHLVSGHVDGVGRVMAIEADARSQRWTFEVPPALSRYLAAKGSVCVDGVSLTVNEVDGDRFGVNLIPHTIEATTFSRKRVGDAANIEVDLIARYLEQFLCDRP
ncbi:MAG: riboflavin synthase [Xanthomonadales bacterium PRO7]|nr:riboflavin synthase [Xanthomonadales bacterium PRO7]